MASAILPGPPRLAPGALANLPPLPNIASAIVPRSTPPGFREIASHLFVPNWNPSNIVLSNEEPIQDALETVLTAKRKNLSENQKDAILDEIYRATNADETVGALRDLPEEEWRNLMGIPLICRIYLKHLVENSVHLSFRELLECDFNSGLEFDWTDYSSSLTMLIEAGFSENVCLEALIVCDNSVPNAMEFLLLSHAKRRSYRERVKKERKRFVTPKRHWTVLAKIEEEKQSDPMYRWKQMNTNELLVELDVISSQIASEHEINRELSLNLERLLHDRGLTLYTEFLRGLTASWELSVGDIQTMQSYRREHDIDDTRHAKALAELGLTESDLDSMKVLDDSTTEGTSGKTSLTCVVCDDAPRDHIVLPCGHVCFCEDCVDLYDPDVNPDAECPYCRGAVVSVVKVFF